jgi:Zn-dependent protease
VNTANIIGEALLFLLLLPAIILHEWAHGYVAYLLGDPTAKNSGRLSLNPIVHIDPFGTLLLPALLILSGSALLFGYAKPVPVNPRYFKNYQTGMLLTGIAGPSTNLILAVVFGLLVRVIPGQGVASVPGFSNVPSILATFAFLNLILLFFNLIPIPPLDGSRVVQWFLKGEALRSYHSLERYGFVIVLAVLFLAPSVVPRYFSLTVLPLLRLLTGAS